jgi:hypothetical protein
MTNSNGNNSDRLDRIEQLFEQNEIRLGRMILQQESDNRRMLAIKRTIQAMLEQRVTDKLEHEERMSLGEARIKGQNRMLASIDAAQPAMLRRLMAIENKVDTLIERNQ